MKYNVILFLILASFLFSCSDSSHSIKKVPDVAQYKAADWKNEVRRDEDISLEEAKKILLKYPEISFFFYVKGGRICLESKGCFNQGTAVFFSGKPWYGSAPGLADAYEKL